MSVSSPDTYLRISKQSYRMFFLFLVYLNEIMKREKRLICGINFEQI